MTELEMWVLVYMYAGINSNHEKILDHHFPTHEQQKKFIDEELYSTTSCDVTPKGAKLCHRFLTEVWD